MTHWTLYLQQARIYNSISIESMNVLLLGRKPFVVEDVKSQLEVDANLFTGTGIHDVKEAFKEKIDVVIMGAGIDIDKRLEIIKEVFSLSKTTTVHMKDWESGPEGMLLFVNSVLKGVKK